MPKVPHANVSIGGVEDGFAVRGALGAAHAELALDRIAANHPARLDVERIIEGASRARQLVRQIPLPEALSPPSMGKNLNEEVLALLSEREQEVARAFSQGKAPDVIAAEFYISPHTVQNHFKSIYRKLGVHSKLELLRRLRTAEDG